MAPNNQSLRLLSISINSRVSSVSTRLDKLLWYRQRLSTMPRIGSLEPSQSKNGLLATVAKAAHQSTKLNWGHVQVAIACGIARKGPWRSAKPPGIN